MERVPKVGIYIGIVCWIAVITTLAFAVSAVIALRVLAGSLLIFGLLRAFLPSGAVPVIRSRAFDVSAYIILALLMAYLSGWAATAVRV